VDIYAGTRPHAIDAARPLVRGAVGHAVIPGLAPAQRHYFRLSSERGDEAIVAQRNVPLSGAVNFRDLGGYATADGRRVQWGRLYRSGHMANLTDAARTEFCALEIGAVCDFRLREERASEHMALPDGVELEILEIPPGVGDAQYFHRVFDQSRDPQAVVEAVHNVVRSMVAESAPRYRRLFEVLLAPPTRNVLINCSAGKERTGVGSALILTALGVPRETIYYDFMLSRTYFPVETEIPRVLTKYSVQADGELARRLVIPLLETRRSYLDAAFDHIDANYGDGMEFLRTQYDLGAVEIEQLRAHYTA
jgi:protein-tyrosine phosphatase